MRELARQNIRALSGFLAKNNILPLAKVGEHNHDSNHILILYKVLHLLIPRKSLVIEPNHAEIVEKLYWE